MNPSITRRNMLCGLGTAVTLPLLHSLAQGATPSLRGKPPKRLVFLNFGFGPSEAWYPTESGANFKLPDAMKPLERHRDSFSAISNLSNLQSSGTGAHSGCTTFLTGADIRRTPGREFHNSISCDQVAADYLGKGLRYASLELTGASDDVAGAGLGASMAWDQKGNPIQGESNHVELFSRLFGDGGMTVEQRHHLLNRKRSILDAVRTDAKSVSQAVDLEDRQKVEQYFGLIRDIEHRLAREENWLERPKPGAPFQQPPESPGGSAGIELMFDLMVAALQSDSTRVISYRMPSNSLIKEFGEENEANSVGAHPMTHFGAKTSIAYQQLVWRDRKLCALFASLLDKMKAVKDSDGSTLLDNSLIVMGTGLHTGHKRENLPILLAGGGGGGVRQGQHYVYEQSESRLANLWFSMLKHVGCPLDSFADSNGVLSEIFV
jgi:hypothetical protein